MRTSFNVAIHDPAARVTSMGQIVTVDFPVSDLEPVLNVISVFLEPAAAMRLGEDLMREAYRCTAKQSAEMPAETLSEA